MPRPYKARVERPEFIEAIKTVGIDYQAELDGSICVRQWVLDAIGCFVAANKMANPEQLPKYLQLRQQEWIKKNTIPPKKPPKKRS